MGEEKRGNDREIKRFGEKRSGREAPKKTWVGIMVIEGVRNPQSAALSNGLNV